MEISPPEETPEPRTLTGPEAREIYKNFRDEGISLPSGIIEIGAQRLGKLNEWGITVITENPDIDASGFIQEHLPGLRVFVEQPSRGEAFTIDT